MVQCKLYEWAPSVTIPERKVVAPPVTAAAAAVDAPAPASEPGPAPAPLSATPEGHRLRAAQWREALVAHDAVDVGALAHREGLDRRVATLRMRIEGLHQELVEMSDAYTALQADDDAREAERCCAYEALCADAEAHDQPLPSAPRSIAGYHDASAELRGADGKLKHLIHAQRGDRAPDWLPALSAVVHTASVAWHEMSRPAARHAPVEPELEGSPFRRAVDATKQVGQAMVDAWTPQCNLCAHADGTIETAADNVIEGGVPFNYSDRFGDAWRAHLARTDACEDARAPLTGPRENGELRFAAGTGATLPRDYSDQGREHALDTEAAGVVDSEAEELAVRVFGEVYEEEIRARWIRDRPNQALSQRRLGAMVATRARRELAKAALARVADVGGGAAAFEDDCEPAPAPTDACQDPNPEPEPKPVTATAQAPTSAPAPPTDLADYNLDDLLPTPWYRR